MAKATGASSIIEGAEGSGGARCNRRCVMPLTVVETS